MPVLKNFSRDGAVGSNLRSNCSAIYRKRSLCWTLDQGRLILWTEKNCFLGEKAKTKN